MLITSRNQQWENIPKLELSTFTEKETAEFIRKALNIEEGSQGNEVTKLGVLVQIRRDTT